MLIIHTDTNDPKHLKYIRTPCLVAWDKQLEKSSPIKLKSKDIISFQRHADTYNLQSSTEKKMTTGLFCVSGSVWASSFKKWIEIFQISPRKQGVATGLLWHVQDLKYSYNTAQFLYKYV